jgi:hypothetical protein
MREWKRWESYKYGDTPGHFIHFMGALGGDRRFMTGGWDLLFLSMFMHRGAEQLHGLQNKGETSDFHHLRSKASSDSNCTVGNILPLPC